MQLQPLREGSSALRIPVRLTPAGQKLHVGEDVSMIDISLPAWKELNATAASGQAHCAHNMPG